ncbi:T6SS phospholipase effector Tle1-like catalytic domain-containing protein [Pseudomonas frederiksbergensis]|uniref:T6SS phospholipase effector Tle1-like catalytic domain-containing protein n=1 Tax=Pseudomonas frederiksbergensis TaxID=104087 RepID=UPI003D0197F3
MSGYVPNPPKNYRYDEAKPVDIHAQRWAEYEKHGKAPAPDKEKIGIALRIGVFFDGTGNNANNTAAGLLCGAQHPIAVEDIDASCKPFMADPDSSYGNDTSNVKELSDLYYAPQQADGEGPQKIASRIIYMEGIGTNSGEKDSLMGQGAGRGDTGVAGRVQLSFAQIKLRIDDVLDNHPGSEITSLTFDTFGFSRGAAAARHFANEIVRGSQGPLGDVLRSNPKAFSATFIDQYRSGIHMGFIGLFDTVPSIAGWSNLGNIKSAVATGIKLYLDRRFFTDVVHLVARDECRANFALSRVKPDFPEITLPGVHSDIGGGYLGEAQECVLISPMQTLDVPIHTDVVTTSIYRDAANVKSKWLAKGWPPEFLEIITPAALLMNDQQDRFSPVKKRVYAALQLKRPVSGKLSRVYLRVMLQLAKEKGVRFNELPDSSRLAVPQELQALCDRFVAGDYSTTPQEEQLLKLKYIHTSANWNHPLRRSDGSGLKAVYINAPTQDAIRVQHPHVPDWTLW